MPTEALYNDDRELLLRIAEGDEHAFAGFFNRWATPLAAIAMKIVQNQYVRQEVVQEVFIKVWLNRDKLHQIEQVGAWLRKVTVNQALLALQKHAAYDRRLAGLQLVQSDQEQAVSLEFKETGQLVHDTIAALPKQRRIIYQMNRIDGKTTREIADALQLSHGYVRNALSAALADIREKLQAAGLTLPILLILSLC